MVDSFSAVGFLICYGYKPVPHLFIKFCTLYLDIMLGDLIRLKPKFQNEAPFLINYFYPFIIARLVNWVETKISKRNPFVSEGDGLSNNYFHLL